MAEKQFRHIVRIANADIKGEKQLAPGLRKIKGVNFMFANLLCNLSGIPKSRKTGELSDKEVEKLNDILKNPLKYNIPAWLLNRRKDREEATVKHLISTDIKFVQENDVKMLKKMRCYKGIRHMQNLPVRGQNTQAHFRKATKKPLGVKKAKGKKSGK